MTLQELYGNIGGDYDQAIRIMRMEKLMDKHIRKLSQNGVVQKLLDAGEGMDPTEIFETAHAMKGVCGNLGLTKLFEAASEISEEFRPGHDRTMSDEEVKQRLEAIRELYRQTEEGIRQYAEA